MPSSIDMAAEDALLDTDVTFPITLASVSALTPIQLAVAAVRDDVGLLIRQRAFHLFLVGLGSKSSTTEPMSGALKLACQYLPGPDLTKR